MLSKRYESTEVDRRTWLHVYSLKYTRLNLNGLQSDVSLSFWVS